MTSEFLHLFRDTEQRRRDAPRRVSHLLHGIHFGGAEEVVVNLCGAFAAARYRGSVICLGKGEIMERRLGQKRIPWQVVPMKHKADLGIVSPLIAALRSQKADLIHTHTSRTNLVGRLASKVCGLPVVTTVHTAVSRDVNDPRKSNHLNAWIDRVTLKWSRAVMTVSNHNREELLRQGGDPDRIVHVPNGVAVHFPVPDEVQLSAIRREFLPGHHGKPVVGMLASMRPRKGPDVLLRAMPGVLAQFPDARLLMVGSGEFVESEDYLETLARLAKEIGVRDHVIFTGHRDDTLAMLSIMDVVVLPSIFGEGLPLTTLEAMALAKPIVTTNTEGNNEAVVHEETGLLVPPNDPEALADAICRVLAGKAWALSLGQKGRLRVREHFSIEKMAERYQGLYDRVIAENAFPA
ncbi:glycosyltransferase family 4 protein [bacterium]|nr:glycosyltransferase family 4 protein [bacterium]